MLSRSRFDYYVPIGSFPQQNLFLMKCLVTGFHWESASIGKIPNPAFHIPYRTSWYVIPYQGFLKWKCSVWVAVCAQQNGRWIVLLYFTAARTIQCPFCWAQTSGTHTGHFNLKNPWYGITYQAARHAIQNATRFKKFLYNTGYSFVSAATQRSPEGMLMNHHHHK